jgi:hypothetical protein
MATFAKFNCFIEDLADGVHQLKAAGHTLKVYLSNDAPIVTTDTIKANVVPITEEHGYAAADIQNDASQTPAGTMTVTAVDVVFTASGGSFGPFQFAVIYNDTPTSPADPLIGYVDYGAPITVLSGETFTVDFGASLMTLT